MIVLNFFDGDQVRAQNINTDTSSGDGSEPSLDQVDGHHVTVLIFLMEIK